MDMFKIFQVCDNNKYNWGTDEVRTNKGCLENKTKCWINGKISHIILAFFVITFKMQSFKVRLSIKYIKSFLWSGQ